MKARVLQSVSSNLFKPFIAQAGLLSNFFQLSSDASRALFTFVMHMTNGPSLSSLQPLGWHTEYVNPLGDLDSRA